MGSTLLAEAYAFPYDDGMKTITASKARANLYRLIEETAEIGRAHV